MTRFRGVTNSTTGVSNHGKNTRSMLSARHCRAILPWVGCTLGLIAIGAGHPALAQKCLWDDNSPMEPPLVAPLGARSPGFAAPGRLATDGSGNLYVTDPTEGRVFVLDPGGVVLGVKTGLLEPSAVALGSDGSIYVAEAGLGSVAVFDPDWSLVQYLGKGEGEFVLPNDIVVDPDDGIGRLYVSDGGTHQVRVYSTSGAFEFAFGEKGIAPDAGPPTQHRDPGSRPEQRPGSGLRSQWRLPAVFRRQRRETEIRPHRGSHR
jgi:DNA-binding beta-propeller fold protein YncE